MGVKTFPDLVQGPGLDLLPPGLFRVYSATLAAVHWKGHCTAAQEHGSGLSHRGAILEGAPGHISTSEGRKVPSEREVQDTSWVKGGKR